MALTKIGATLGGSADVITVTQNNHGLLVGRPVRMTSSGYVYATANTAPNAEAIGIIIAVTTNTLTIALGGRVTVDECVPSGDPGTVLFLQLIFNVFIYRKIKTQRSIIYYGKDESKPTRHDSTTTRSSGRIDRMGYHSKR